MSLENERLWREHLASSNLSEQMARAGIGRDGYLLEAIQVSVGDTLSFRSDMGDVKGIVCGFAIIISHKWPLVPGKGAGGRNTGWQNTGFAVIAVWCLVLLWIAIESLYPKFERWWLTRTVKRIPPKRSAIDNDLAHEYARIYFFRYAPRAFTAFTNGNWRSDTSDPAMPRWYSVAPSDAEIAAIAGEAIASGQPADTVASEMANLIRIWET